MSRENHLLHFHISKKRRIGLIDKVAVVAAFVYPLTATPQVIEIFKGNIDGVSLLTWFGFILFALFFIMYGLVHKITPINISNNLLLLIDGLVVAGVVTQGIIA